jgi:hypothetical protein
MNFYTMKIMACALLLQSKRSMARRTGLWIFNSAKNIMEVQYSGLQERWRRQKRAKLWNGEAESQKLYKTQQKELKAAAALYKKQQLEEARKAWEIDKERKKQEQKAKAERLAVTRLEKQHQKNAANTQKALQLSQGGKRPASQKAASKPKRARTDVAAVDGAEAAEAAPKLISGGHPINPPRKFE